MLEGWYCRSIANNNVEVEDEEEDSPEEDLPNYKDQYRNLKRKLKFLIYENECFQEALRSTQRKLLKVNRDKSFLLDRLLQYEKVDTSFSESDDTESSEDESPKLDGAKRKKVEVNLNNHSVHTPPNNNTTACAVAATPTMSNVHPLTTIIKPPNTSKKKKSAPKTPKVQNNLPPPAPVTIPSVPSQNNINIYTVPMVSMLSDGHMTPEEVERHLESRQTYLQLVPEKAPPTVPTEMFSNDPSLDSESNEIGEHETSPSNIGDDCLDMMGE